MEGMILSYPRPKPASWIGLAAHPPVQRREAVQISIAAGEGSRRWHSSTCRRRRTAVPSIWHAITPSTGCFAAHRASTRWRRRGSSAEEGTWNVAWDARPARWLHGPDSAWLLFGLCSCLSPPDRRADRAVGEEGADPWNIPARTAAVAVAVADEKPVERYKVTGVPADGRCMFRALAYGACLVTGKEAPDEIQQKDLADDLRARVVDELLKRRKEVEWFIEENFDIYIERIRQPYVWGGEPELLMATHVLQAPLSVFMLDRSSGQLSNIAIYGQEYEKEKDNSIKVLFYGYGHYDALEILTEIK